jgi:hypothetical protein
MNKLHDTMEPIYPVATASLLILIIHGFKTLNPSLYKLKIDIVKVSQQKAIAYTFSSKKQRRKRSLLDDANLFPQVMSCMSLVSESLGIKHALNTLPISAGYEFP